MKKHFTYVLCLTALIFSACNTDSSTKTEELNEIITQDEEQFAEFLTDMDDVFWANQWDDFRFSIVNNDSDFDMLKHYNPDQISEFTANQLLDDEYTVETLKNTPYEALEDASFDGMSVKAFYVVVASADIMVGTIYYFQSSSYGLQLVGSLPY